MSSETSDVSRAGTGPEPESSGRSAAEWTTLGVSVLILVVMFGLVIWFEVRGSNNHPHFTIKVDTSNARHIDDNFYVDVLIRNDGDETVEALVIEATLQSSTDETEVGEIQIDFLAGGEQAKGTFVFGSDPAAGDLSVRPVSYSDP
jgi:uncharacterized protein (TIGR02588 family)